MTTSRDQSATEQTESGDPGKGILRTLLNVFYGTVMLLAVLAGVLVGGSYFYFTSDLPQITSLKDYRPAIITAAPDVRDVRRVASPTCTKGRFAGPFLFLVVKTAPPPENSHHEPHIHHKQTEYQIIESQS